MKKIINTIGPVASATIAGIGAKYFMEAFVASEIFCMMLIFLGIITVGILYFNEKTRARHRYSSEKYLVAIAIGIAFGAAITFIAYSDIKCG